jgi:cytoskeletal protein CcmA (bactofilin family)
MFKKSEEQEWTRFRGALSKDRDEAPAAPPAPDATEPTAASATGAAAAAGQAAAAGPSFRSSVVDVNVGLPGTRLQRGSIGDTPEVESLIGEHTSFEGTLRTEGSVRLLGSVSGEIESKNAIIVEDKAHVTARLTARQVTVAGQVDGQIYCDGRVEIRPSGRVTGEINAGALIIQEGAYFDGNSRMANTAGGAAPGNGANTTSAAAGATSIARSAEVANSRA